MAATERVKMVKSVPHSIMLDEVESFMPGLRIGVRTTTASLSDYPEVLLEDLVRKSFGVVSDGACS